VSATLLERLRARLIGLFDERRVVVWTDPSSMVEKTLRAALPERVEMPPFRGNPLSLRQAIDLTDPWLDKRWLLYVPRLPDGVRPGWLADYERGFLSIADGSVGWLLRELYEIDLPPDVTGLLESPVVEKVLARFEELFPDGAPKTGDDVLLGFLRATLGDPALRETDVVLQYLVSDPDETALRDAGLLPALTRLIISRLGLRRRLTEGAPPDKNEIARCMVASALVEVGAVEAKAVSNQLPDPRYRASWAKALENGLAQDTDRELRAVVRMAMEGSKLAKVATDPMALAQAPPLAFVDARMLELLRERPDSDPSSAQHPTFLEEAREAAERRSGVERLEGEWRERWRALARAASVIEEVRERERELQEYPPECFERLLQDYVKVDHEVDRAYRALPSRAARLPEPIGGLVEEAREQCHRFARTRARMLVEAAGRRAVLRPERIPPQRAFFRDRVASARRRVAVLLIDALRADLAHDLAGLLRAKHRVVETELRLAELPTRTEVGMAALLPHAEREDAFAVRVENGRLVASIEGERVANAPERRAFVGRWGSAAGRAIDIATVDAFLAGGASRLRAAYKAETLPFAWTTEVDDAGPIASAVDFSVVDKVLEKCASFADAALAVGFEEVAIATDHGFLLRDRHAAPGGVPGTQSSGGAFARSLRYAVGHGETGDLVCLTANKLGRRGDDVFVPRDTSCLALPGGPGLFLHGGLSPEECALLFLRVEPGDGARPPRTVHVRLSVDDRVSSLTFKVTLGVPVAPAATPSRRVRIRVRDQALTDVWTGQALEVRPPASEESRTVVVTVRGAGYHQVVLEDVDTGDVLEQRQIEVQVLGDDFGF
jgi:hypothetical protein